MKKSIIQLPDIKLVGISIRTNNAAETNLDTAKIGLMVQRFFDKKIQEKINDRKNPGRIFSCYTNYDSDVNGDYTYFIGEEVSSLENINNELVALTIPAETYAKFFDTGIMPNVLIEMWKKIWVMNSQELGGERSYVTDFEIFDEKTLHQSDIPTPVEVYISIDTRK